MLLGQGLLQGQRCPWFGPACSPEGSRRAGSVGDKTTVFPAAGNLPTALVQAWGCHELCSVPLARLSAPHLLSAAKKPVSPYSGYNGQLLTSVYQPTEMALMHKGPVSESHPGAGGGFQCDG